MPDARAVRGLSDFGGPALSGRAPGGPPAVGGTASEGPAPAQQRTNNERRRFWGWLAFLGFAPVCLGVVVWAAVAWNGSYPTVPPPVPTGWQAVAGIYASFSVPKGWALQPGMADTQGDAFYSGRQGAAGEMVREAKSAPRPARQVPPVVATFLGGDYRVESVTPVKAHNATKAWEYRFELSRGEQALGILAWVRPTESQVWLVALPASDVARKVLSTLTLAT